MYWLPRIWSSLVLLHAVYIHIARLRDYKRYDKLQHHHRHKLKIKVVKIINKIIINFILIILPYTVSE